MRDNVSAATRWTKCVYTKVRKMTTYGCPLEFDPRPVECLCSRSPACDAELKGDTDKDKSKVCLSSFKDHTDRCAVHSSRGRFRRYWVVQYKTHKRTAVSQRAICQPSCCLLSFWFLTAWYNNKPSSLINCHYWMIQDNQSDSDSDHPSFKTYTLFHTVNSQNSQIYDLILAEYAGNQPVLAFLMQCYHWQLL